MVLMFQQIYIVLHIISSLHNIMVAICKHIYVAEKIISKFPKSIMVLMFQQMYII